MNSMTCMSCVGHIALPWPDTVASILFLCFSLCGYYLKVHLVLWKLDADINDGYQGIAQDNSAIMSFGTYIHRHSSSQQQATLWQLVEAGSSTQSLSVTCQLHIMGRKLLYITNGHTLVTIVVNLYVCIYCACNYSKAINELLFANCSVSMFTPSAEN